MNRHITAPTRGRPRTITRERLTDAAIAMGLPNVSVVGIATTLGVSPKALYKHFSGLDALKQLVAEEIFLRWPLPSLPGTDKGSLEQAMLDLCMSMWALVEQHAGIAPYMLRKDMVTPAMMKKMKQHQEDMAKTFGISFPQANWLLFTVTYYCVAVADTVLPLSINADVPQKQAIAEQTESDANYAMRVRHLYVMGSRALVTGALAMLDQVPSELP